MINNKSFSMFIMLFLINLACVLSSMPTATEPSNEAAEIPTKYIPPAVTPTKHLVIAPIPLILATDTPSTPGVFIILSEIPPPTAPTFYVPQPAVPTFYVPPPACTSNKTVPLQLYWNMIREDNFTTATEDGVNTALVAGYQFWRTEGHVFPDPQPGTVPLKLYWSMAREDNYTTATEDGENNAINAGYQFWRIEGYVFPDFQPGTIPLKLYWSNDRGDNFTTATEDGENDAVAAGYQFWQIEGYICP